MTRLLQELPNRIKWLNTKFTVDSFRKRFSSLSLCKSHFLFRIIIFRIYYYSQINKIEIVTIIRIFRSYFIYHNLSTFTVKHGGIGIVEFSTRLTNLRHSLCLQFSHILVAANRARLYGPFYFRFRLVNSRKSATPSFCSPTESRLALPFHLHFSLNINKHRIQLNRSNN